MRKWLHDHPSALQTWGLAGVAILCVLALGGWKLWQGNEEVVLVEGRVFRSAELTAIQTALACANVDHYRCEDGKIYVPRRQRNACLQALQKSGVLRSRHDSQLERLTPGILDTRQAREQKRREQLQIGLAQVIESIRGIAEASVRYSEFVEGGLHRRVDRRALVAVRAEGDQPLSLGQQQAIRQSVIASVAGLNVEDVTITDLNYPQASQGPASMQAVPAHLRSFDPAGANDRVAGQDATKVSPWRELEQQVRGVLGNIEGLQVAARQLPSEFIDEAHVGKIAPTGYRRAVDVEGELAILLHITAPADVLAKRFGASGSEASIAQTAAVHLRTAVQRIATRPVAVVVTAEKSMKPPVMADAPPSPDAANPTSPLATDVAAQLKLSAPQLLWTCPLLLVAMAWLWSAWRRDRLAKEFSAEVRQRPEQLASVLESWASDDAIDASQVAS